MDEKLLYTLITEVSIVGKPYERYTLKAELYVSYHKRYQQPKWLLKAELTDVPLQGAHWSFTTPDFPPISSIQETLAERIGRQLGCASHEVIFHRFEWRGF